MHRSKVNILLQHDIKEYIAQITDPYDFANLLRALKYTPSNGDIRKYLNPTNHIFYRGNISDTLDEHNCRMLLIGNSLKYADIQLNVSSKLWNEYIADKLIKVFCLVICTESNHKHHKLDGSIRRGSNVFAEICEVKLGSNDGLGFATEDAICINANVMAERFGHLFSFEPAFERRYASNITGLKSCCYISYPSDSIGIKVTDRQLFDSRKISDESNQVKHINDYNYLILYFNVTEIYDEVFLDGYRFDLF